MNPAIEPESPAKKRLAPFGIVIVGIVGITLLFLVLPSSRAARIRKARAELARSYPLRSQAAMQPLFEIELVGEKGFKKFPQKEPLTVYIFAPDPKSMSAARMINEICQPSNLGWSYLVPMNSAVLLAPDPASTGWSLFAKVWIARYVQGLPANDIKSIGLRLVGSGSLSYTQLKAIWAKIPEDVQSKAEGILEKNRTIAKLFRSTCYVFHDAKGINYEVRGTAIMTDLLYEYYEAYPETRPQQKD